MGPVSARTGAGGGRAVRAARSGSRGVECRSSGDAPWSARGAARGAGPSCRCRRVSASSRGKKARIRNSTVTSCGACPISTARRPRLHDCIAQTSFGYALVASYQRFNASSLRVATCSGVLTLRRIAALDGSCRPLCVPLARPTFFACGSISSHVTNLVEPRGFISTCNPTHWTFFGVTSCTFMGCVKYILEFTGLTYSERRAYLHTTLHY